MTAQVVIMNKLAAALASDSSVTLTRNGEIKRSFLTAEKIFPLGQPHRVAVLSSGDSELLGVPFALLLAEWGRSLGDEPRGRVSDYASSFCSWVEQQTGLFTTEAQDDYLGWVLRDYFLAVRRALLERCTEAGLTQDIWPSPAAAALVEEVVGGRLERLRALPRCTNLDAVDPVGFFEQHASMLHDVLEWVFDDTPRSGAGDNLLREVAQALLSAREPFSTDATLVFVGFGQQELFPASQRLNLSGIFAGKLKSFFSDYVTVSVTDGACISGYGQTEAMDTFLEGYHDDFLEAAHRRLEEALNAALTGGGDATKAAQLSKEQHDALVEDFSKLSWKEYVEPLVNTVAGLPKADVARISEALVGLQVLRQLTRAEAETVGGPLDVGVLTREEGFSWFRHKSLFRGER